MKSTRRHIKELEESISEMKRKFNEEINTLKMDIWKLENPPKYKAGDKVIVEILQSYKCEKETHKGIIINPPRPIPSIFFGERYWKYDVLINNNTISVGSPWIKLQP